LRTARLLTFDGVGHTAHGHSSGSDACGLSLLHDKQNMRERRRQTYWSCQALGLGLELRVVAAGCAELGR
jgi:hypothetical protein